MADDDFGQPWEDKDTPELNEREIQEAKKQSREALRMQREKAEREARERETDWTEEEKDARMEAAGFVQPEQENTPDLEILDALVKAQPGTDELEQDNPTEMLIDEGDTIPYAPALQDRPAMTGGTGETNATRVFPRHLQMFAYIEIKAKDPNDSDIEKNFWVHGYTDGSGVSSGTPASKMAIVPYYNMAKGELEYIGWFCAEEPEARFFDTIEVPLNFWGRGTVEVPPEFIESVEEGSIRVVSTMSTDVPAACSGVYSPLERTISVEAVTGAFKRCRRAVVRLEGVRKDSPERWKRFTEEQAIHNNAFWDQARGTAFDE